MLPWQRPPEPHERDGNNKRQSASNAAAQETVGVSVYAEFTIAGASKAKKEMFRTYGRGMSICLIFTILALSHLLGRSEAVGNAVTTEVSFPRAASSAIYLFTWCLPAAQVPIYFKLYYAHCYAIIFFPSSRMLQYRERYTCFFR